MAVGFGDAGAEIIADNMRSGGDLNPMVPGQKVTAIFGFCDVRQFTDATEILQVPHGKTADVVRLASSLMYVCPRHLSTACPGCITAYLMVKGLELYCPVIAIQRASRL